MEKLPNKRKHPENEPTPRNPCISTARVGQTARPPAHNHTATAIFLAREGVLIYCAFIGWQITRYLLVRQKNNDAFGLKDSRTVGVARESWRICHLWIQVKGKQERGVTIKATRQSLSTLKLGKGKGALMLSA